LQTSGPLYPPPIIDEVSFSCEEAATKAFTSTNIRPDEIDFFGLYDCFPICLLRALEAVGLAKKGEGGRFIETVYRKLMESSEREGGDKWRDLEELEDLWRRQQRPGQGHSPPPHPDPGVRRGGLGHLDPAFFPVNTHGGLLGYGAPWEVPAIYSVIEAVTQLRGKAIDRQIERCRRALVYGNGGIFSHSAIAILEKET
jgi:acetyl-CoA acetyltransferase